MKMSLNQQQQASLSALPCRIFYSTQSGRAKACARRTARIINDCTNRCDMLHELQHYHHHPMIQLQNGHGSTLDDALYEFMKKNNTLSAAETKNTIEEFVQDIKQSGTKLLICFISTTGDGEHTVRITLLLVGKFLLECFANHNSVLPCSCIQNIRVI
jgi:hypothetical protein